MQEPGTHDFVTSNRVVPVLPSDQHHSLIDLDDVSRLALMITPQEGGDVIDQAWEAVSMLRSVLRQQSVDMTVVQQTVFLRSLDDVPAIGTLMKAYFGARMPATSFIVQPPCGGQALAIEAWAIGGPGVRTQCLARDVIAVSYDDIRWVYLSGIVPSTGTQGAYGQSEECFNQLQARLSAAHCSFRDVPRVWLYQGQITSPEQGVSHEVSSLEDVSERYRELNRARSDFFDAAAERGEMMKSPNGSVVYPASTGIGTGGPSLLLSALAIQTSRSDVHLVRLENPLQTSAFDYERKFSLKSPKFSRAMAVVMPDYTTTWISGTASILNSATVHPNDVVKQTHQTIDNIAQLISPENFDRHDHENCGASLADLAKVRVYVKRIEDYPACLQVCQERFGNLPAIFAIADVCRPDLLVEIEGVAFSKNHSFPKRGK